MDSVPRRSVGPDHVKIPMCLVLLDLVRALAIGAEATNESAREEGEALELRLEYAVELKSKQDLRSENQQAAFLKRNLELTFKFHDS